MVQQGMQGTPKKSKFEDPNYPAFGRLAQEKDTQRIVDDVLRVLCAQGRGV